MCLRLVLAKVLDMATLVAVAYTVVVTTLVVVVLLETKLAALVLIPPPKSAFA